MSGVYTGSDAIRRLLTDIKNLWDREGFANAKAMAGHKNLLYVRLSDALSELTDGCHVEAELEQQQQIQMNNPPTSEAWQQASKRIGTPLHFPGAVINLSFDCAIF